jgi:hypothetical protein
MRTNRPVSMRTTGYLWRQANSAVHQDAVWDSVWPIAILPACSCSLSWISLLVATCMSASLRTQVTGDSRRHVATGPRAVLFPVCGREEVPFHVQLG